MPNRTDQSGWLVERSGLSHRSWEMLSLNAVCRLIHLRRPVGLPFSVPEIWNYEGHIRSSAFRGTHRGAAVLATDAGSLELIASNDAGGLAHFSLLDAMGWQGPIMLPGLAAGPPAFIQSRFGNSANFEVIIPRQGGGLSHFWRDIDISSVWREATQPSVDGNWSGVGLIHGPYGNLEIVGIRDGELRHQWQNGPGGPWSQHITLASDMRGRPALIQSSLGHVGNFEVVAPRSKGGLAHFWRNNDDLELPWSSPTVFGQGVPGAEQFFDDVTLLGVGLGDIELMAKMTIGNHLQHFRRKGSATWYGPLHLLRPTERNDD